MSSTNQKRGPKLPAAILGGAAYLKRKREPRECDTMFWQGVLTVLSMLLQFTLSRKPGIVVKPLPQGILIQQKGGLFYQTAEWVALTTITTSPPTLKLQEFAVQLESEITKVRHRLPQLTENWNTRLQWCKDYLTQFQPNRQKRAPLGFIGRLSHTLFGTVTEEELSQYRNILMDNRNSLNSTIHRTNLLLSSTKVNRKFININWDHISKIQRYLSSVQKTVVANFRITSDSVQILDLKVKLEHTLVSLEQSVHRVISFYNRRRRQINSLYHHLLTEDLLPPSQLQKILKQAQSLRFATMPVEWYYENCRVSPVWTSIEEFTFRVTLPLHDGKNYIFYSITSFPFPIRPGFNSIMQVENKVAYSSTTGLLFRPILCLGTQQRVCRGGPLFEAERFKCERALISSYTAATKDCRVKILLSNQTIIEENTPGLYIISTPYITPKLHCDALGEETVKLTAGVYIASFNHTCTLRGSDWTLPGALFMKGSKLVLTARSVVD